MPVMNRATCNSQLTNPIIQGRVTNEHMCIGVATINPNICNVRKGVLKLFLQFYFHLSYFRTTLALVITAIVNWLVCSALADSVTRPTVQDSRSSPVSTSTGSTVNYCAKIIQGQAVFLPQRLVSNVLRPFRSNKYNFISVLSTLCLVLI